MPRPRGVLDRLSPDGHTGRPLKEAPSDAVGEVERLRVDVRGDGVGVSQVLRGKVVRRVVLALGRFGKRVRQVTVRMAEPANRQAGVERRCRMRAWLKGGGDVAAEAIDSGFETAAVRALVQLEQRLAFVLSEDAGDRAGGPPSPPGRPAPRSRSRGRSR